MRVLTVTNKQIEPWLKELGIIDPKRLHLTEPNIEVIHRAWLENDRRMGVPSNNWVTQGRAAPLGILHAMEIDELGSDVLNLGYHVGAPNHWFNPEQQPVDDNSPHHWHTDSPDGRSRGADMVIACLQPENTQGTLISGPIELEPYKVRHILQPWRLYWLRGDVIHISPPYDPRARNRMLIRFYQEELFYRYREWDGRVVK